MISGERKKKDLEIEEYLYSPPEQNQYPFRGWERHQEETSFPPAPSLRHEQHLCPRNPLSVSQVSHTMRLLRIGMMIRLRSGVETPLLCATSLFSDTGGGDLVYKLVRFLVGVTNTLS